MLHCDPLQVDVGDLRASGREMALIHAEYGDTISVTSAHFEASVVFAPASWTSCAALLKWCPGARPPTSCLQPYEIFVNCITGKTLTYWVTEATLVLELKEDICRREGIRISLQRLIFASEQLEDKWPIRHYKIQRKDTIHLVLRLKGC